MLLVMLPIIIGIITKSVKFHGYYRPDQHMQAKGPAVWDESTDARCDAVGPMLRDTRCNSDKIM